MATFAFFARTGITLLVSGRSGKSGGKNSLSCSAGLPRVRSGADCLQLSAFLPFLENAPARPDLFKHPGPMAFGWVLCLRESFPHRFLFERRCLHPLHFSGQCFRNIYLADGLECLARICGRRLDVGPVFL